MNNRDYWIKRFNDIDAQDLKDESKLLKELYKLYEKAYNDTIKELNSFYGEYGDKNGLTHKQAQKALTPIELKECTQRIKRLSDMLESIDTSTPFGQAQASRLKREIQLLRNRGKVTREMRLTDAINEVWIKTAYKIDKKLGDFLKETYNREYKDILEETGVEKNVIPVKAVENYLLTPTFGNHFSDSVWNNKDKLVAFIRSEIRTGLVRGTNVRTTAKKLQKHMGVTYYEAKRLVATENMVARTMGALEGYKASRVVKKVEVLTIGDERMCHDCGDLEGRQILLEEVIIGTNAPPLHPNCRCVLIPVVE